MFHGTGTCQKGKNERPGILLHGLVCDAETLAPLAGSHIVIDKGYFSVTKSDGTFSFYISRNDTVVFTRLGYKSARLIISDTLSGKDYLAGIYLHPDTISIGEVIIVPRFSNLKSELLNTRPEIKTEMENARYNVAVSAYIGRNSLGSYGDPVGNYGLLRQKQRINAFEKGGIPSDQMLGLNPFVLLPAAYSLFHGLPEKPGPYEPEISDREVKQMHERYLEILKQRK